MKNQDSGTASSDPLREALDDARRQTFEELRAVVADPATPEFIRQALIGVLNHYEHDSDQSTDS